MLMGGRRLGSGGLGPEGARQCPSCDEAVAPRAVACRHCGVSLTTLESPDDGWSYDDATPPRLRPEPAGPPLDPDAVAQRVAAGKKAASGNAAPGRANSGRAASGRSAAEGAPGVRPEPEAQPGDAQPPGDADEIGRASCRDRVCQSVLISVVAGHLKKKTINKYVAIKY